MACIKPAKGPYILVSTAVALTTAVAGPGVASGVATAGVGSGVVCAASSGALRYNIQVRIRAISTKPIN